MRIRTVKPEWLDDERIVCASPEARVMTIALILLADDHGRGRASLPVLAGRVFPGSANPREDASRALDELASLQFVLVYEVDGQSYYLIRNWSKHQRVDRPSKSQLPAPPDEKAQKRLKNEPPANVREDSRGCVEGSSTDQDQDQDQDHGPLLREAEEEAEEEPRTLSEQVAAQVRLKPTPGSAYRLLELLSALHCQRNGAPYIEPGGICSQPDRRMLAKVITRAESMPDAPPMAHIADEWTALIALAAAQELPPVGNAVAYFAKCFGDLERRRSELAAPHVPARILEAA